MNMHEKFAPCEVMASNAAAAPIGWLIAQVGDGVKQLGARLLMVLCACDGSWAAAELYENLSRLSDAELERRGIPRGELHRCVSGQ